MSATLKHRETARQILDGINVHPMTDAPRLYDRIVSALACTEHKGALQAARTAIAVSKDHLACGLDAHSIGASDAVFAIIDAAEAQR